MQALLQLAEPGVALATVAQLGIASGSFAGELSQIGSFARYTLREGQRSFPFGAGHAPSREFLAVSLPGTLHRIDCPARGQGP